MNITTTLQSGLFAQLEPLLTYRAVLITVSKLEGDQLQVNVCPRQLKEGENPALTIPLCVTGTAAELDAELVAQVSSFVASHAGLNTNLIAIEKEIADAEKTAREEAKKKQKVPSNGVRKASDSDTPNASAFSKSETQAPQTLSLFEQQPGAVMGEASRWTSNQSRMPAKK